MATIDTAASPPSGESAASQPEVSFRPHRMTVERFEHAIRAGVYTEDDPVFLWMGRIYEKMAPGEPHVFATTVLAQHFARVVPRGWYVLQEQPIILDVDSMPEPDLTVVRGSIRDYLTGRARAVDISLVVEVADSSAVFDSHSKMAAYARASIPLYWIVYLKAARLVVFGDPTGPSESPAYRSRVEYGPGDEAPIVVDGFEVGRLAVEEILP